MTPPALRIASDTARREPRRVAFTLATIRVARCSAGNRTWLYDARQPGLAMMITAAGAKSFYVYRKVDGRPQRVRLGAFPDITIEQARKLAQKTLAQIAAGVNPMAQRREARAKGMSVGELWTWFLEHWAKPRKRSWTTDENRYDNHLKPWSARRLADITRADVAAMHHRVSRAASPTVLRRAGPGDGQRHDGACAAVSRR